MLFLLVTVLFTAPLVIASEDTALPTSVSAANSRVGRARKEIPLLLIRPVQRPSLASMLGLSSSKPSKKTQIKPSSEDMKILENILPQLGLNPSMFSAYPTKYSPPKVHIFPVQSNEVKHGPNFKNEYHLTIKETPSLTKHSYFEQAPSPPKFLSSFEPSHYSPPKDESSHPVHEAPAEPEKPEEHHYAHFEGHEITSDHFEPKPIEFDSIPSKEELVIGKPSASHPSPISSHSSHEFKIPEGDEHQFYIPKDEDTASFEVKSKTENVQFVPESHEEHHEIPEEHQPHIEYLIPEHEEHKFEEGHPEEYFKNFDTEEYFLPKKEPDYHKMMGDSLFNPPKPQASPLHNLFPFDNSFTLRIKEGEPFPKIHIAEHVFKPHALPYQYKTPEHTNTFYPNPHKEYDTKYTPLHFNHPEPSKKFISSTYKAGEIKNETNPDYKPPTPEELEIIESKLEKPLEENKFFPDFPSSITHDYKDYFKTEHNPFYHGHRPSAPAYKPYIKSSYPGAKPIEVRPVFESHHDEYPSSTYSYNDFKNEYNPKPIKLYLSERENESSPIAKEPSHTTPKFELKFPSKSAYTTPKITTYKQKSLPSGTTKSIEATTESVNLLSGIACERQCIRNTVSQEYDPVCGSDGKTYSNKGKLRCTRTCGPSDLAVRHYGGCGRNDQPTTSK